ncbi:phosphate ABC transporter substrate-binding protein [Stutzerimonas nosocomialis]|uniref:phosphate ABC transporter substrate-binding protein n=1 Tax=Stutzerimonas nosocomialis TaxID=1056496 RepID=UPI0011082805|nr:phosphate ABC transporter substrate-binding protein [Stutzerimonas nosocomialis]TLX55211.1 phosphate ABC transporter substrate-binding protein [Stutzerimonas nosocomialis]
MKAFTRILGGAALLGMVCAAQAEVAVIVNPGAAKAPNQSEVANIFLGKDKSFKGVDLKDWTPAKEAFYTTVTNKNESQLKSYWSGLVFTGKGQPLPTVADDAAVVARVASETDAIGYVDSAAVNDQVKVLFTLP